MFDYIVIGAGSAGCVLAHRLSSDADINVLLLEAGTADEHRDIRTPIAFQKLYRSSYDWAYETHPQRHLGRRRLYWPRGKVLGGSSSLNAMIYIRGHSRVYDQWGDQVGREWSFGELLPYFRRAEDQQRGADAFHGVGGPLSVADQRSPNPLSLAFVEACTELGFPRNEDFNGAKQQGAGLYQVTQRNGVRCSAAAAYLRPILSRRNLTVLTEAHAWQLILREKHVIGVRFLQDGAVRDVHTRREVLLAGGAVNSPQLLLLSGIGPAEELRRHGIAVRHELAGVGQDLQDHLAISVAYECLEPVTLLSAATREAIAQYRRSTTGPLTSNVAEAGLFLKTRESLAAADLQFHFVPGWFLDHGFRIPDGHGFTFTPTLIQPASRGSIRLRSPNPFDPPCIEPNYLSQPSELDVLRHGFHLARQLAATKSLTPYRGREVEPGPEVTSSDEVAAFVREKAESLYHPVGTCRMGVDSGAVVDAQLRVHGLRGLRVVDASIMPSITNGNTNAPTIMIAEKGADLIRQS